MSSIASLLEIAFSWGGVCIDSLGVSTPASIWGEWVACGPLLVFITVTLVDKPELSVMDWFQMISFLICLCSGFVIIFPQPKELAMFWLVLAIVSYLPMFYLPVYVRKCDVQSYSLVDDMEDSWFCRFSKIYAKRFNLSMSLLVGFSIFPIVYLLAYRGVIDASVTVGLFEIMSVATKSLYVAVIMDIHLDALLQAQRALVEEQRANEARRAFLKYIFHEVRTPLNSLTMGIEILERSNNLDTSDRESLLMMKGASDFMCDTLNDVLSMQKIEEGKLELDLCPFSINDAVSKVFSTFRGSANAKSISLVKRIAEDVPDRVVGDRYRVEHVISNLLSNAIKFSADGKTVHVEVKVERLEPVGELDSRVTLAISVRDEGPGISAENQKRLFANFVQIRPGQLQQGQGSGLGLALCMQIVTLHGGTIAVTSAEGKGSDFHFSIPFLVYRHPPLAAEVVVNEETTLLEGTSFDSAAAGHILKAAVAAKPPNIPPLALEPVAPGVLVVDDVSSNRKMLKMLLKKSGIEADLAENGLQAVEMVLADLNKYQVVFMDNLMPIMNGVEATRKLREGGFRNLVVGVTGNVLEDDVAEYLQAGADIILGKPMKINVLGMVFKHVKESGYTSQPGMTLVEHSNRLKWQPVLDQLVNLRS